MLKYKVAGIVFRIESRREKELRARIDNFSPFELAGTADEAPLFSVSGDCRISLPEGCEKTFEYDVAEDKATLYIYPDRQVLSIRSVGTGETFSMECPVQKDADGILRYSSDLTDKKLAPPRHIFDHLMIFAFSRATYGMGILLIHSSSIVYRNRAVLFLGESGTGKSTHSRLWLENILGARLLNDDAPAIRVHGGTVTAYGTPWSGKTPCYKNEEYPVAACVRIRQAPENKIHGLQAVQAFGALLPSALPSLQQDEKTLDALCATISAVISSTPVYILDCLPNREAAILSSSTIYK